MLDVRTLIVHGKTISIIDLTSELSLIELLESKRVTVRIHDSVRFVEISPFVEVVMYRHAVQPPYYKQYLHNACLEYLNIHYNLGLW